ncbi:MAG: two-component system, cell cycle response regulator [Rhodobacteraceae bacterium HLUCCA12]|nr:MAG: two-component system, cell cycle response regulator [Rhodobacteraceae bacterium HLUCCA12]
MSGKILIVDDLAINRIILKVKLAAACHDSLQAACGQDALAAARAQRPKLILLDMMLPDISGIDVCRQIRADPQTRDIPVVIITASSDRTRRLEALAAGADDFLTKPLNEAILLARIRNLLRTRETEAELRLRAATCRELGFSDAGGRFDAPGRIALIAADPATAMSWRGALAPLVYDRLDLLTPQEALTGADGRAAPDLYMIAANLGHQGDGLRLLADLRSRLASRDAAISLVVPAAESETAAMALDLGANDLLTLPFDPQETALRLRLHIQRKRRAEQLRRQVDDGLKLAITDPLTGLFNRRYAMAYLDRMANRTGQAGTPYALMVLDLDRFKSINDRHGHAAGDTVLRSVAERIRATLQPGDLLARIGGEEFLVALPDATAPRARQTADALCDAVASAPIALAGRPEAVCVTVSVGLAMGRAGGCAQEVLFRADSALLSAKAGGRNRVTVGASAA